MLNWFRKLRSSRARKKEAGRKQEYIDVKPERDDERGVPQAKSGLLARIGRGSKRDQQIASLQAGYNELLGLIASIRTHLEGQTQTQQQLLQSLDRFNGTLTKMDETSRRSAQTMSELALRARESEELLRNMLERSERRLVILISLLLVATVGVLGAAVYFGLAARGQPQMSGVSTNLHVYHPDQISNIMPAPSVPPKDVPSASTAMEELADDEVEDVMSEESAIVPDEDYSISETEDVEDDWSSDYDIETEPAEKKGLFGRRGFLFFRRD